MFTKINLNETWTCIVFTSRDAKEFYNSWVGHFAEVIDVNDLNVPKFHIDAYNFFLMDENLWESLDYDKCLVFQDDGVLLRPGIERFMAYDYVGAPWADAPGNEYLKKKINQDMVGNGGLSLRTVSAMSKISTLYQDEKRMLFFNNLNNIPEDVYFCWHAKRLEYAMPSTTIASEFSSEELLNMKSIGFHKVWGYHHPTHTKMFFNGILNE
jgi:hypothetical protein